MLDTVCGRVGEVQGARGAREGCLPVSRAPQGHKGLLIINNKQHKRHNVPKMPTKGISPLPTDLDK